MAYRFQIQSPATETAIMGADFIGGMVFIQFFNGGGSPVTPTGRPVVERSEYATGNVWRTVEPFSAGEWRFNAYAQRVRVNMAGVSGYASYRAEVYRCNEPVTMVPDGAYTGMRANVVQYYDEINKKRGAQWEASRLITIADNLPASNAYSILRTGSKPVDLKARAFGYTGLGVIGRIYEGPTYSGGTADPWYNMNTQYIGQQPEAQLLTGFTLTALGTKCGADIIAIGPISNQSRGSVVHEYARNRILPKPNTAYLLEIASIDPASQQVSARVEMYEGGLDWPIPI
jgi:hypothetical protein